jgi:NAD(P)-dependent dehydrogenase (short-subunit alcohol dehydrogenase family)
VELVAQQIAQAPLSVLMGIKAGVKRAWEGMGMRVHLQSHLQVMESVGRAGDVAAWREENAAKGYGVSPRQVAARRAEAAAEALQARTERDTCAITIDAEAAMPGLACGAVTRRLRTNRGPAHRDTRSQDDMANPFSYEGKRVVVTGGGGAGMGAAAVVGLNELGAEIHVIDLKDAPIKVASHQSADLRDPDATAAAIEQIGGTIDALFNCAGLPGPPFSDVDTMLVNFAANRHLAHLVAPYMTTGGAIASISSTAGSGYLMNIQKWLPLVRSTDFAEAKAWIEAHPDDIAGGYSPSKEALIVWTLDAAMDFAEKGIRLNCISPGPTDTPMMPAFEDFAGGGQIIDLFAQGLGRRSKPEEQAWPLIFLNSDAASYVSGENLVTDGGTLGAMTTGRLVLDFDPESLLNQ